MDSRHALSNLSTKKVEEGNESFDWVSNRAEILATFMDSTQPCMRLEQPRLSQLVTAMFSQLVSLQPSFLVREKNSTPDLGRDPGSPPMQSQSKASPL
jgi:hypothetical protein